MANDVYANGREVSCKCSDGKSICAFPDVCLSPPSPPAGPVPIPYPNTAMASDTTSGSKTVKVSGKEVMLKDKSFFKKSTGDEAATKSLGMGVITHQIQGKVYFTSWSMDVKVEGENVVRHLDLTTHNHMSLPPNTPPWPHVAKMTAPEVGADGGSGEQPRCECCKGEPHSKSQAQGSASSEEEFYTPVMGVSKKGAPQRPQFAVDAATLLAEIRSGACKDLLPASPPGDDPCARYYLTTPKEKKAIETEWNMAKRAHPEWKNKNIAHRVPKAAGGCPAGKGNLTEVKPECQDSEKRLADIQSRAIAYHRGRAK